MQFALVDSLLSTIPNSELIFSILCMVENDMYITCNICKRASKFDFTQIITDPQKFIVKCLIHTKEPHHELYSSYDKYVLDVKQNNLKINNKTDYPLIPVRFEEYNKWFIGMCMCSLCKKLFRTHYLSVSDSSYVNMYEHIERILSKPIFKKYDFGKMGVWYDCSRCGIRFYSQEKADEHVNKCVVGVSYDTKCNHLKPKYGTHRIRK